MGFEACIANLLAAPAIGAGDKEVIEHLFDKVVNLDELRVIALEGTLVLLLCPLVKAVSTEGVSASGTLTRILQKLRADNTDEVLVNFCSFF